MKRTPLIMILLPVLLLALFQNLFACACCAEKGTYFTSTSPLDDYEREILSKMKFAAASSIYLDAAGFDVIEGLEAFRKISESSDTWSEFDEIVTRVSAMPSSWVFSLSINDASGQLTLPVPSEREYFAADIHDREDSSGGGPLLYKELRFRGKVGSGNEIFAAGLNGGADYFLVFQGRGNGCNNVEDFTHWRLSVSGPNAGYSFFGKLTSGDVRVAKNVPAFGEHPAAVWSGRAKAVNLNSHSDARMFRTRLREARNDGVNFAGHFIFTYWGCGTNCLVGAVIDGKTGRVFFPAGMGGMGVGLPGMDPEKEALEFRKDSSLMIVRGALSGDDDRIGTHYLVWEGDRFRKLEFVPADTEG